MDPRDEPTKEQARQDGFGRRLLMVVGAFVLAGALVVTLWRTAHVLLILFAAILAAIGLDGLASGVRRRLHLPRAGAVTVVVAVLLLALAGFVIAVGPQLADQSRQLADLLPRSVDIVMEWLRRQPWGEMLTGGSPLQFLPRAGELLGPLSGIFSTTVGALVSTGIILVMAVYLVAEPRLYTAGFLHLLPPRHRNRAREVLGATAHALRWWLVGRAVSMLAVGMLTGIGLWLIDLRAALALAVLAGLLSFVPYIGPIASAAPALLIAAPGWPWTPLWVVVVYAVVQFLEGNLITPFVQSRAVSLPPVVLLTAQLVGGIMFGLIGVFLATPLAVVVIVLVQTLYVQDVLGEPIRLLGDHRVSRP